MILFNTRVYDSKRDEVKFMDGKLRSKEAFYASGFNSEMIDGKWIKIDIEKYHGIEGGEYFISIEMSKWNVKIIG